MSSDRNPPPSNKDLLILLGLFVGAIVFVVWVLNGALNLLIGAIPPAAEQQLGRVMIPALEELATEPETQDKLNALLDQLETHLPEKQQERDYRLLYIPDETVNAMAVPGDVVVVYQGLIDRVESENELMMVLGHELGHFANRDHLRGIGRAIAIQLAISAFLGDVSGLPALGVGALEHLSRAQFSQSQERQADELGLELLNAHYGHVNGATDFFARLAAEPRLDIPFLGSHPAPGKRVKTIEKWIKQRGYRQEVTAPLNLGG
ncbi:MAG: M48 family metallopeptidase [Spirulina sp. SIO3F2]|nr:M48 family metallopeptidase [Spirulina sp. SIO3F2]